MTDDPIWLRENVREFEEYGLGEYQPSRLVDGSITYEIIKSLEAEFDVQITIRDLNPEKPGDSRELLVNHRTVTSIGYARSENGYSIYDITRDEFVHKVEQYISQQN